jgi:hypothetical protein
MRPSIREQIRFGAQRQALDAEQDLQAAVPLEQLAELTVEDGPAQDSRDCVRRGGDVSSPNGDPNEGRDCAFSAGMRPFGADLPMSPDPAAHAAHESSPITEILTC